MLTPTLTHGLHVCGIGEKLRALRLKRKLGLVALVYGVGLDHFFTTAAPRRALGMVRAAERKRFPERLGGRDVAWFLCLLSGKLGIVVAGVEHVLSAGDSMYFDSSPTHGYRRPSTRPPEALVVTVAD